MFACLMSRTISANERYFFLTTNQRTVLLDMLFQQGCRGAKENLDELLLLQHVVGNSLAFRRDADKGKMEESADDAYPITLSFAGTDNSNEDYIVGRDKDRQGWEAWEKQLLQKWPPPP